MGSPPLLRKLEGHLKGKRGRDRYGGPDLWQPLGSRVAAFEQPLGSHVAAVWQPWSSLVAAVV